MAEVPSAAPAPRAYTRAERRWIAAVAGVLFGIALYGTDRLLAEPADFLHGYQPGALSLWRGEGYLDHQGQAITHWPPGYSLLIAPWVAQDPLASMVRLRWFSGVLGVLHTLLLAGLCRRLLRRKRLCWVLPCALLWPPLLALTNPALSEQSFAVLATAAASLLVRLDNAQGGRQTLLLAMGAGLLLGAATLVKTLGLALLAGACLGTLLEARRWSRLQRLGLCGLLALLAGLVLLPWLVAFWRLTGTPGLTTAGMESARDGWSRFEDYPQGGELARRTEAWHTPGDAAAGLLELASEHPAALARILAVKLLRPWYATDSGRYALPMMALNLPVLLLLLVAGVRHRLRRQRAPRGLWTLLAMLAAVWLAACGVLSIFRYLAPLFPFAVVVIAGLLDGGAGVEER